MNLVTLRDKNLDELTMARKNQSTMTAPYFVTDTRIDCANGHESKCTTSWLSTCLTQSFFPPPTLPFRNESSWATSDTQLQQESRWLAMGLVETVFVMVTLACAPASGWFWWTAQTHATTKGKLDSQCVAHGEAGRCDFYKCFEDRLPCGEQGYMVKYGQPYCARFERVYAAFSPQGQDFINGTNQCLTRGLLSLYRADTVDCHRLSHDAFDLISSCYFANGFCDVVEENAAVFADVFQARHLFMHGALKIWKEIMEIIYQCNPDQIHQFARSATGMISNLLWNSGDFSGHS